MKKITKQQIIDDLLYLQESHQKLPTKNLYLKYGTYGLNTIVRRYGKWNNALQSIFGEVNLNPEHLPPVIITCKQCGKEKERSAKAAAKSLNHFCSKSCAASYNNKHSPRRPKAKPLTNRCRGCGKLIRKKTQHCKNCINLKLHLPGGKPLEEKTLGETICLKGSNRYRVIRDHAVKVVSDVPNVCLICGYEKHINICHLKPIHSFELTDKVGEINAKENLVKLCRNHHWELDHKILDDPIPQWALPDSNRRPRLYENPALDR